MAGQVEEYLLGRIREDGAIHLALIDPEKVTLKYASFIARESELCQTSAIMIGGSTLVSSAHLDAIVKAIKKSVEIPVILFPNNITGVSRYADAIWFMSLINSLDPYFITGVQVLAAPLIKKFGLEAIPLGYIIMGEGGSVGVIGRACVIPYNKPDLAAAYALAAQYFGMRFVYLEAGSGAKQPVPREIVSMVKKNVKASLIVGGGIRTGAQAREIANAGSDIIVTSTTLEESRKDALKDKVKEIIEGIKEGVITRNKG